ncbi:MAG: hypothetical protein SOT34_05470 [Candidatus Borkfalkiaceae bacterium]|nr:hypothetical protein [Christensenellaceae bacterium]
MRKDRTEGQGGKRMSRKILGCILSGCIAVGATACGGTAEEGENDLLKIPDGYTLTEPGERIGTNAYGVGVEFDPHFLSQNIAKGVSEESDWQIVADRVEKMGIDRFRVMILPSWIEPMNDNDDPSSVDTTSLTTENAEMRSLYRVLDLAQANGIDVNLTLWGVENKVSLIDNGMSAAVKAQGGHFLNRGNSGNNWVLGTLYPEEFAENLSIYLQHLFGMGYTCIKEVTPINEPNWSYIVNNEVEFENYKTLCYAVHDRLTADGLRDKVKLNLSDNTDTARSWLESTMEELDGIADIYNSHTYIFGYGSTNDEIRAWEEENINVIRYTQKPHMIGEFGSDQTTGSSRQSDIDLYERGVLMVRQMLNFYNAGASGASYWVLCDEYYNFTDSYEAMMMLGLWKGRKETYVFDEDYYRTIGEDYEVRPQYHAISLMSKHVPKGGETYPVFLKNDYAVGTAFKGEDGKWTYVFANGNEGGDPLKIALRNGNAYGEFDRFVYEKDSLPSDDSLIPSSGTLRTKGQVLSFELAPGTVLVLKQK